MVNLVGGDLDLEVVGQNGESTTSVTKSGALLADGGNFGTDVSQTMA